MRCCVPFCSKDSRLHYYDDNDKISMHSFPQDEETKKAWFQAIGRQGEFGELWKPNEWSVVCCRHFKSSDFKTGLKRKRLLPEAIPSVFEDYPKHTQKDQCRMPTCSAVNCSYKHCSKKTPAKSIHRFPFSRPEILQQWITNVGRKNWMPSKTSVLCSAHFKDECFSRTGPIISLKPDAVPTVFNFPSDLEKVPLKEQETISQDISEKTLDLKSDSKLSVDSEETVSQVIFEKTSDLKSDSKLSVNNQDSTLYKSREMSPDRCPFFKTLELIDQNFEPLDDEIKDLSDIEFPNSEDTKQKLDIMTTHYKRIQKKLKVYQRRCYLYKKEINSLKQVIHSLQQINSVKDDS